MVYLTEVILFSKVLLASTWRPFECLFGFFTGKKTNQTKRKINRKPNSSLQLGVAEFRCDVNVFSRRMKFECGVPGAQVRWWRRHRQGGGCWQRGRGCGCAAKILPRFGCRNDPKPVQGEVYRPFIRMQGNGGQDLGLCSPWLFLCLATA